MVRAPANIKASVISAALRDGEISVVSMNSVGRAGIYAALFSCFGSTLIPFRAPVQIGYAAFRTGFDGW
jgi:hypothetical protein